MGWFDVSELQAYLGEEVTRIQKATKKSLFEISEEIFGDEHELIDVFRSFDKIKELDNALAAGVIGLD